MDSAGSGERSAPPAAAPNVPGTAWEADVALRDGTTVRVRAVREDDAAGVRAFYAGLSDEARWMRFFSGGVNLDMVTRWSTRTDGIHKFGLIALTGADGQVVGHAGYQRTADDPSRAEMALAVADAYQGRGLGTLLLGELAQVASTTGVTVFDAEVLPVNHRMIRVFRDSGFPVAVHSGSGVVLAEFPTELTPAALERYETRERGAAVAALHTMLSPRSVAVVGASRRRGTVGGELFHNLLAGGFQGPVYPVNPSAAVIQSVLAYPTVLDVPGPVDLAVIVVPAGAVVSEARRCAAKGVRGLVVISAGFAETDQQSAGAGMDRQAELLRVCRESGMRLIGPNCLGVVNTDPDVCLHATFGPVAPARGRIGFLSQSGALGLAIVDHANALGLGLSSFVSVGNKADLSGNDLLNYWEGDPGTDVVLLYLESFGNPRKFSRIARRVARTKPIVAVKSGRSVAGARATSSHTGALLATSDVTVDALFRQAGVIRTESLSELFDVASLLARQPLPRGGRVGIVTNAGGPGIMCADACEAGGLEVAPLPETLRAELARLLPAAAATGNPVDLLASATAEHYRQVVSRLLGSGEVDAVIVIFIPIFRPPAGADASAVTGAVRAAMADNDGAVPVLGVFMTAEGAPAQPPAEPSPDRSPDGTDRVPAYRFPEEAARALAKVTRYATWRAQPEGEVPMLDGIDRDRAAAVVATALANQGQPGAEAPGEPRWLDPDEVAALLGSYGLPMAEGRLVPTPAAAGEAAAALGGPVALKAVAPGLVHKTEAGAVRLALNGHDEVRAAAADLVASVAAAGHRVERFLVQRMVPPGVELLVGVVQDPSFGPVVACGAGGTVVELLGDVSVRLTPLTRDDAAEMVRSLDSFPLLEGYRGAPGADVAAVEDVLLRVSALVEAHPEVLELDCNPVMAGPDGAVVVDARVRLGPARSPELLGARRR
jgi:acetyl coenzyme A synthetase (ADP forming)-like protein